MRPADHYRGAEAAGYDAHRVGKPEWSHEQAIIDRFVTDGPVLDCPVGTGRFLPLYRAKGLYCVGVDISPDMLAEAAKVDSDARLVLGDVRSLRFVDRTFATAVCSRLLNWFYPAEMVRAIRELRRVADCLVLSIRTGPPGDVGNYTHDLSELYGALDGLIISDRVLVSEGSTGAFEIIKARAPVVADVLKQFGERDGLNWAIKKARDWTDVLGVAPLNWSAVRVSAEYWWHDRIGALVSEMGVFTDDPPRRDDGPLTVLRTPVREAMLDGRRRSNVWMKSPGRYPVLVIEPC